MASLAQVTLFSVKNPPPADSVRVSHFKLALFIDTSKAPQPHVLLESLIRRSPRQRLPLVLLPNNRRQAHLAPDDSVPVSLQTWIISITVTSFFLAANKTIFGQPSTGAFGTTTTGTGTGIFYQQPQQKQPALPATGLFGTTTTGTISTGPFGQRQQPQQLTGREHINAFFYLTVSHCPQAFGTTQQQQNDILWGEDDRTVRSRSPESTWRWYFWPKDHHAERRTLRIYHYLRNTCPDGGIV